MLAGLLTVPPCLSGFCYAFGRNSTQYKATFLDFVYAVKYYYLRSVVAGLPWVLILLIVVTAFPWLSLSPPAPVVAGIVLQILALLLVALLSLYVYPLLALFDLQLRWAWAYSLVLVIRWPVVAVGLLGLALLATYSPFLLGPAVLLVLPLMVIPFVVNTALVLVRRAAASGFPGQKA
jgi:hypothetical protein